MSKQQFQAMKFRVESPEQSKKIQEYLFSLGYKWNLPEGNIVRDFDEDALFTDTAGYIKWSSSYRAGDDFFEEQTYPEYALVEHTTYSVEPVPVKDVDKEKKMKELQDAISEMEGKLKELRKMVEEVK